MDAARRDPFVRSFFSRVSKDAAASFTDAQLAEIKRAFGPQLRSEHPIDIRFTVPLGFRSFYVVLLAGHERRSPRRRILDRFLRPLWTIANVIVVSSFALLLCGSLFAVLYAGKMALGINVFSGIDVLPDKQIGRLLH